MTAPHAGLDREALAMTAPYAGLEPGGGEP